jgi:hypothetical protein
VNQFLWGALATCAWIIGIFFLRFWRLHGDRLFLFFFVAFWALAFNWLWLALVPSVDETRHYAYLLRLLAFTVIIIGVADKNRRGHVAVQTASVPSSGPTSPHLAPQSDLDAYSAWH